VQIAVYVLTFASLLTAAQIGWLLWTIRDASHLADTVGTLESRMKSVETEWLEVYDKLNRLAGRLTKERGLLNSKNNDQPATPEVPTFQSRSDILLNARR